MAAMNSCVLACNYGISGTGSSYLNAKLTSVSSVYSTVVSGGHKLHVIRAQQAKVSDSKESRASEGRRAAMLRLAATLFTTAAASSANAGVIDDYLEKSKANKELNDKKRLATSGANFARAYTVEFGSCKFPENFTGCQDLAKQKYHSSLMIWPWSVKERTNTSVVPMFSGNGEEIQMYFSLKPSTLPQHVSNFPILRNFHIHLFSHFSLYGFVLFPYFHIQISTENKLEKGN
ncbi:photosystem I reaction center subunit N, chloroplastic-like isoform X2 [Durio zibethinus]|uniref:Photosystem I reaction center subunit N, chloroplastic-like isoform X2 n=1 Tax=Durio zibethinus TaxID=66656 RepID=A0A6P5YJL6_DURZI|nr:photosystem I reaction center subunit N, chloroplastic-like isoform X2 [Durio zibethinus]